MTALQLAFFVQIYYAHNFEDKMEKDSTGAAERTEPVLPLRNNINEDTCVANSHAHRDGTCGTTDVARARWTLLRQVLLPCKGNINLLRFYAILRVF